MRSQRYIFLVMILLLSATLGTSAPREPNTPNPGPAPAAGSPSAGSAPRPAPAPAESNVVLPRASVTEHTMLVNGQPLRYRATAGYMPIESASGSPLANLFFVAYERLDTGTEASLVALADGATLGDPGPATIPDAQRRSGQSRRAAALRAAPTRSGAAGNDRPIMFAFNGGPGAASLWLHVGGLGPKRVVLANDGTALPRVDRLVDNESTWLTFTDLVFVDPIGTGFSHTAPGVEAGQFYEVQKDIEIAADFVRLFVTKYERWLSPQFIVGESYGTTRAVGAARYLQKHYGLYVRGLVLLSSALNLQAISPNPGNDLPYVLSVPSYAAVASYHGRLQHGVASPLDRFLPRVRTWTLHEYLTALAQGELLSGDEAREIARSLAEYTGLQEDTIIRNHLRISAFAFTQELLSRENRVLGLLDGRVTAPSVSIARGWTDPSLFVVKGPFVATFNNYLRSQLGFRTNRPYVFLSDRINEVWNWGPARTGYLNVAPHLAEAMGLDDRLRVFGGAGYYDLTAPYLSQEYVFNHLDLPADLRSNLTFRHYYSGHQIYTSPEALRQLTADVRAFVTAVPAE